MIKLKNNYKKYNYKIYIDQKIYLRSSNLDEYILNT